MAVDKNVLKALDLLPHLATCAKERRTITYAELGEKIGHPAFYMGPILDILRDRILPQHRTLPRIDSLVVSKETGEAGDNYFEEGRDGLSDDDYHALLTEEREKVFVFKNWDRVVFNLQSMYGGETYIRERKIHPPACLD